MKGTLLSMWPATRRGKSVTATLLFLLTPGCQPAQQSQGTTAMSDDVQQALAWLPADTETIIVAQSPFPNLESDLRTVAVACKAVATIGVPKTFGTSIMGKAKLVVNGSRKYGYPKSLGMCPYEGCKIMSFDSKDMLQVRKVIEKSAKEDANLAGIQTWTQKEKSEKDDWTYTFAIADDRVFCATNAAYLKEVLTRMKDHASREALPETLEQWKHVDFDSTFWCVRNFSAASRNLTAGLNMGDKQVIGYGVVLDPKTEQLKITSISDNKDQYSISKKLWEWEGMMPTSKKIDERTSQFVFVGKDTNYRPVVFVLLAAVGHGVLI